VEHDLPERDDMACPNDPSLPERALRAGPGRDLTALLGREREQDGCAPEWRVLRCVASGYLSHGCSCDAAVPAEAVVAAWARERRSHRGDRFFSFRWNDETWLAFGLRNGLVRGVYCPEHRAQRFEHESLERLEQHAAEQRYRAAVRSLTEA
jgi:hypothetical protein